MVEPVCEAFLPTRKLVQALTSYAIGHKTKARARLKDDFFISDEIKVCTNFSEEFLGLDDVLVTAKIAHPDTYIVHFTFLNAVIFGLANALAVTIFVKRDKMTIDEDFVTRHAAATVGNGNLCAVHRHADNGAVGL